MWLSGWIATPWASRKTPMVVFGPKGTVAMTGHLTEAFADDIRIRENDEHLPPEGIKFAATDIEPGFTYEKDGLKVTAIEVDHGEKIKPAFGYVVEYDGKKVVLSGDTKYDDRVANAAKGADLLIHEVAVIEPELLKTFPAYKDIKGHHSSPEEAGRIFSIARPKLAVYSPHRVRDGEACARHSGRCAGRPNPHDLRWSARGRSRSHVVHDRQRRGESNRPEGRVARASHRQPVASG